MIPIFKLLKAKKLLSESLAALTRLGFYDVNYQEGFVDACDFIDRVLADIEKEIDLN